MTASTRPCARASDITVLAVGFILVFFYQIAAVTWADSGDASRSDSFFEGNFVLSHRGDITERPENTFVALNYAYDCGVRLIEIDVRMTADMVPIAFHDATLERTANASGDVSELTWEQIRDIDVGSSFSEDFAGERIPLMADVFVWLSEREDLVMWVHLRFVGGDEEFSTLIGGCGVESQVVIQVDSDEVERLDYYRDCLGRAAIIKEPFMPFVVARIASCKEHHVDFMTVMDVLASKYLYEITSSNGMKVMLTRNFGADENHIEKRFSAGGWGFIIDSAKVAGDIQQHLMI